MTEDAGSAEHDESLKRRLAKQSEEAIGRLAQELMENPVFTGAVTKAMGAREHAARAQEVAMGALNLPSAADLERLTRRLRSVSQRLEAIEDSLDTLKDRGEESGASEQLESRLTAIEQALLRIEAAIGQTSAAS
jgi:hypothetical protein